MTDNYTPPNPPKHLAKPTQAWFAEVCSEYEIRGPAVKLLTLAAEAWDRCQQAREAMTTKGTVYEDRFGQPRARPEVAIERDNRIGFIRALRALAIEAPEPTEA